MILNWEGLNISNNKYDEFVKDILDIVIKTVVISKDAFVLAFIPF
jgi:hypothetical protein